MDKMELLHKDITDQIINAFYRVYNELGFGFLEKIYENALAHELRKASFRVRQQHPVQVRYDGVIVGDYVVDLLVEDEILVELKAVKALDAVHKAQCLNYLRATNLRLCLLFNFGTPHIGIQRIVL